MGATSRFGLRYPESSASATIWTWIKNLADDVEARLATLEDASDPSTFTVGWSASTAVTFSTADNQAILANKHCVAWAYLVASNSSASGAFSVKAPLTPATLVRTRPISMGRFTFRFASDGTVIRGRCISTGTGDAMRLISDTVSPALADYSDVHLTFPIAPNDSLEFNLSYPVA